MPATLPARRRSVATPLVSQYVEEASVTSVSWARKAVSQWWTRHVCCVASDLLGRNDALRVVRARCVDR